MSNEMRLQVPELTPASRCTPRNSRRDRAMIWCEQDVRLPYGTAGPTQPDVYPRRSRGLPDLTSATACDCEEIPANHGQRRRRLHRPRAQSSPRRCALGAAKPGANRTGPDFVAGSGYGNVGQIEYRPAWGFTRGLHQLRANANGQRGKRVNGKRESYTMRRTGEVARWMRNPFAAYSPTSRSSDQGRIIRHRPGSPFPSRSSRDARQERHYGATHVDHGATAGIEGNPAFMMS